MATAQTHRPRTRCGPSRSAGLDDAGAGAGHVGTLAPGPAAPGCSAVSPPTRAQPARRAPLGDARDDRGDPLRHDLADGDVVGRHTGSRSAPHTTRSSTTMATRSMPIVSWPLRSAPVRGSAAGSSCSPTVACGVRWRRSYDRGRRSGTRLLRDRLVGLLSSRVSSSPLPDRRRQWSTAEVGVHHTSFVRDRWLAHVQRAAEVDRDVSAGRRHVDDREVEAATHERGLDQRAVRAGDDAQLARVGVGSGHRDADGHRAAAV